MSTTAIIEQLQTSLAGRYVIGREVGRGGMATVYLARDLRQEQPDALELLDPEVGATLGVEHFLPCQGGSAAPHRVQDARAGVGASDVESDGE